jgi:hypothetical protein
MAFNADNIWDFPADAVVAAEAAVVIGPDHAAPVEVNPGAVLQAAVLQREIRCCDIATSSYISPVIMNHA